MRRPRNTLVILLLPLLSLAAKGEAERFTFSGERMETVLAQGREWTRLSGNAELISDDTLIHAGTIELYGDNFDFALTSGGVRVVNPKQGIELTSDSLFYNRRDRVSRTQGSAVLVDRENEIVVKGGFIEDWEEREETIVQIGVRIFSDDLVARAEFARYDRAANTLNLSGRPLVTWKGDEYRAARIFIDLDEDTIRLEGTVSGEIATETDDGSESTGAPPTADPSAASDAAPDATPSSGVVQ